MKGILGLLRSKVRAEQPQSDAADSTLFSTAFASQGAAGAQLVPWEARAVEVGAQRLPARRGGTLLQSLWARDKYMGLLGQEAVERTERFFTFAESGSVAGAQALAAYARGQRSFERNPTVMYLWWDLAGAMHGT